MKNKKVAIIVGHSKRSQGARNYLGESEYNFNRRIAQKLVLRLQDCDIPAMAFLRKGMIFSDAVKDIGKRVNAYKPYICLELHFNSFKTEVNGAEMLCLPFKHTTLATKLLENFEKLKIKNRGVKLVRVSDRGYKNLDAVKFVPYSYIVEPCFANFRNEGTKNIIEDEHIYVTLLCDTILGMYDAIEKHVEEKTGLTPLEVGNLKDAMKDIKPNLYDAGVLVDKNVE